MDKIEWLRRVFPAMEEQDLAALAEVATPRAYPADTVLCREGETEDIFYVIVSGQVEVVKQLGDGVAVVLNRAGAGQFVGEIALVQKSARTATVRTLEPTEVLEIGHADFIAMLERSGAMAVRVVLQIIPRLREIDQATIAHLRDRVAELEAAYEKLEKKHRKLKKKGKKGK